MTRATLAIHATIATNGGTLIPTLPTPPALAW